MSTANDSQIKCLTLPWSEQARQNYVPFDEFSSLLNWFSSLILLNYDYNTV